VERTRFKGTRKEVRALGTFVKLVRATESITSLVHRHLIDAGLSVSQFGVLEALFHVGPLSQGEIAKKILRSTGNITMVIGNLEKRGLVTRDRQKGDRRYYSIQLTDEGKQLIESIFPRHTAKIMEAMMVLNSVEQETLGILCRKLGLRKHEGKKHYHQ
jgi:MarR family 2-MHQ and catechol resistance regulon transcriptional repressor